MGGGEMTMVAARTAGSVPSWPMGAVNLMWRGRSSRGALGRWRVPGGTMMMQGGRKWEGEGEGAYRHDGLVAAPWERRGDDEGSSGASMR